MSDDENDVPAGAAAGPAVQLQEDQLARLLAAVRGGGGKKVSPFSTARPSDWLSFKRHFINVGGINHWNDPRCRRELAASMEGEAARLTRDLDVMSPDYGDWEDLLAAFEAKFVPPVESDLAASAFETAVQEEHETPTLWAARLTELFMHAYPADADNIALEAVNARIKIHRFTAGLRDPDVARYVHEQRALEFDDAVAAAQARTASNQFMMAQWGGARGGRRGGGRDQ